MKFVLTVFLIISLLACKKDKPEAYPVPKYDQFLFAGLTNFTNHRLFTKEGEITNSTLVNKYVKEYRNFFYEPTSSFSGNEYKSFSMVNEDSIINMGMAPVGELKRTTISDYDVFTGKFNVPVNDTNSFNLHLGKYKLHKLATTPLGYSYYELNQPANVLKRVNNKLYVPIIRYIITSLNSNYFSFGSDKINNVFDPTVTRKLGNLDTLLVQTFDLELRLKQ
jgi:hypothetical protein